MAAQGNDRSCVGGEDELVTKPRPEYRDDLPVAISHPAPVDGGRPFLVLVLIAPP